MKGNLKQKIIDNHKQNYKRNLEFSTLQDNLDLNKKEVIIFNKSKFRFACLILGVFLVGLLVTSIVGIVKYTGEYFDDWKTEVTDKDVKYFNNYVDKIDLDTVYTIKIKDGIYFNIIKGESENSTYYFYNVNFNRKIKPFIINIKYNNIDNDFEINQVDNIGIIYINEGVTTEVTITIAFNDIDTSFKVML